MIRIPTDQPEPPPQVFALAAPNHVLAKLYWEIKNLHEHMRSSKTELFSHLHASYMAFNVAVTAWHLCDWVWHSWSQEDQRLAMAELSHGTSVTEGDFRGAMSNDCRALKICQQIANGSKHKRYDRADGTITAAMEWTVAKVMAGSSESGESMNSYEYKLVIYDNDTERDALEVFDSVFQYWRRQLEKWGFIEGDIVLLEDGETGS